LKGNIRERKLDLFRFSKMYRFFLLAQKQSSAANLPAIFDEIFIVLKERIFFTRFFSSSANFNSSIFKRFFYYKFYLFLHSNKCDSFFFPGRSNKFYFRVDFNKEQPYYSILTYRYKTKKVFSTGFLLKLHNLFLKKYRRSPSSYGAIVPFFKKFFFSNKFNPKTLAVFVGYKHKYKVFIQSIIKLFIAKFCIGLFFELQVKMLKFKFRRVKSIKKRIKKRIIRNDKKFKSKIRVNMVD